jgi:hypothetical protein
MLGYERFFSVMEVRLMTAQALVVTPVFAAETARGL